MDSVKILHLSLSFMIHNFNEIMHIANDGKSGYNRIRSLTSYHINTFFRAFCRTLSAAGTLIFQYLMLLLKLALNSLEFAIFCTYGAAYALILVYKGFLSVAEIRIYGFCRTYLCAYHAICAFAIIYFSQIIVKGHSIKLTCFNTFLASYAAYLADFDNCLAFICIFA